MRERLKQLTITVAISFAIHLGTGYGMKTAFLPHPVIAESIQIKGVYSKTDELALFREKKRAYVEELQKTLKEGKNIRMSEFLIKSWVLDKSIEALEHGKPALDLAHVQQRYERLVAEVRASVKCSKSPKAIHRHLHKEVLSTYYKGSGSIYDTLSRGWYNCNSSTELYSSLLEDVAGIKNYSWILYDDHIKSYLNGYTIENTEHKWNPAPPDGCGLILPRESMIATYLVGNDVPLNDLPKRLAAYYLPIHAPEKCLKVSMKPIESRSSGRVYPFVGAVSGMDVPDHPVSNPDFRPSMPDKIVLKARALLAVHRMSQIEVESESMHLKTDTGEISFNPFILPEGVDWGHLLEEIKPEVNPIRRIAFPAHLRRCFPIELLSLKVIPEIIESLPDRMRYEEYTRDRICGRYREVAKTGTIEELENYSKFTFCAGVNTILKERYLRENNIQIIIALKNMSRAEDYPFFMDLIHSRDLETRRNAATGAALADPKRGCAELRKLGFEKDRGARYPVVSVCGDTKYAWDVVFEAGRNPDQRTSMELFLMFISGKDIDTIKVDFLKKISHKVNNSSKSEIARILYEYGDKEGSKKVYEELIKKVHGIWLCGTFPEEFNPMLDGIIEKSPITVAKLFNSNEDRIVYPPKLVDALQALVINPKNSHSERVEAAFMLLLKGYEPIVK